MAGVRLATAAAQRAVNIQGMIRVLFLLAACFLSLSANAAPLVLGELPAAKYCPNAPSTGLWTDLAGHCRFALEGAKEDVAVVSINGVEIHAPRRSVNRRPGKAVKTFYASQDGRVKISLMSRVTGDSCQRAKNTGCGITRTGTLMVWSPKGRTVLTLSRYDGA
jgi:hypothetical protein